MLLQEKMLLYEMYLLLLLLVRLVIKRQLLYLILNLKNIYFVSHLLFEYISYQDSVKIYLIIYFFLV